MYGFVNSSSFNQDAAGMNPQLPSIMCSFINRSACIDLVDLEIPARVMKQELQPDYCLIGTGLREIAQFRIKSVNIALIDSYI